MVLRASWLLALALLLASCIRLNEPDAFSCGDDSDCQSAEKCLVTLETPRCVPENFCGQNADCLSPDVCIAGSCTLPECQAGADGNCAPYACDFDSYHCRTDCFTDQDCALGNVCFDNACVARECEGVFAEECAPYQCVSGRCSTSCMHSGECTAYHECQGTQCVPMLRVDGARCSANEECASQQCCPSVLLNVYECGTECTYTAAGAACAWSPRCASQSCVDGACAECLSADCADEACTLRECGAIAGVSCGECGARRYCDAAGQCLDACGDRQCGVVNGVSCGECGSSQTCVLSTGQCIDVCEGWSCGYDHGALCGTCGELERCNESHQCDPVCVGYECGTDRAFVCGECGELEYCSDEHTCEIGCDGRECGTDHGFACGQCDSGELCEAGQCVTGTCVASEAFCEGESAYVCSADATERTLVEPCDDDQFCNESTGTCMTDVCTAGEVYCAGSRRTTCTANGGGGELGGTDCNALGASCHVLGCGTLRWDAIAPPSAADLIDQYPQVGNIYLVNKAVTLTSASADVFASTFDSYLVMTTVRVYQADALNGPYTSIYVSDLMGEPAATDLDIELSAGKYYAIIVRTRNSHMRGVRMNRSVAPASPITTSFGTVVSGHYADIEDGSVPIQPTPGYIYHQTLYTLELAP